MAISTTVGDVNTAVTLSTEAFALHELVSGKVVVGEVDGGGALLDTTGLLARRGSLETEGALIVGTKDLSRTRRVVGVVVECGCGSEIPTWRETWDTQLWMGDGRIPAARDSSKESKESGNASTGEGVAPRLLMRILFSTAGKAGSRAPVCEAAAAWTIAETCAAAVSAFGALMISDASRVSRSANLASLSLESARLASRRRRKTSSSLAIGQFLFDCHITRYESPQPLEPTY